MSMDLFAEYDNEPGDNALLAVVREKTSPTEVHVTVNHGDLDDDDIFMISRPKETTTSTTYTKETTTTYEVVDVPFDAHGAEEPHAVSKDKDRLQKKTNKGKGLSKIKTDETVTVEQYKAEDTKPQSPVKDLISKYSSGSVGFSQEPSAAAECEVVIQEMPESPGAGGVEAGMRQDGPFQGSASIGTQAKIDKKKKKEKKDPIPSA